MYIRYPRIYLYWEYTVGGVFYALYLLHGRRSCRKRFRSLLCPLFVECCNIPLFLDGGPLMWPSISSLELHDYEHLGIAMTFKNLVMMFPMWCVSNLPSNLLESFISYMSTLTCNMGCAAAQEETVGLAFACLCFVSLCRVTLAGFAWEWLALLSPWKARCEGVDRSLLLHCLTPFLCGQKTVDV